MKTQTLQTGYNPLNRLLKSRGFSLFELLIVLFLMSLFMTFLTLRLEGFFSEGALREAAKTIIEDIGMLRAKAAYTHLEQRMVFNVDENSFYTIEKDTAPDNETKEPDENKFEPVIRKLAGNIDIEDVMFLTGEKVQEGEASLRFFPNGSVQSALIHLKNNKEETITLEINPLTGRITIYDTYIEKKIIR